MTSAAAPPPPPAPSTPPPPSPEPPPPERRAASTASATPAADAPRPPFCFSNAAFRSDPYPFYARARRDMPIFRLKSGRRGDSFYVCRYDDVMVLLKDTERFVNDKRNAGRRVSWLESRLSMGIQDSVVMRDGEDHRRLRTLVHMAFTPARIGALDARIRAMTTALLDEAEARGGTDMIADLALPLPVKVISELMGVDEKHEHDFHKWMNGILELDAAGPIDLIANIPNLFKLHGFLRDLIEHRRTHRGDDLLSAMIAAEEAGDRLSFEELVAATLVLLLAGHETTVNLIGSGMLALLEHPSELAKLRAQPELMDSAVEEMLRFTSPVQINAPRYARVDTELCGVRIPRGASVTPLLGSANHDETRFDEPERFDVARVNNKHVAFGFGPHYCLGAALARLEAKAVFSAMLERYATIELSVPRAQLAWRRSQSVRGLMALPLRLARTPPTRR